MGIYKSEEEIKRWIIISLKAFMLLVRYLPSSKEQMPNYTALLKILEQYEGVVSELEIYTCDQKPGELVLIPPNWYHLTHSVTKILSII